MIAEIYFDILENTVKRDFRKILLQNTYLTKLYIILLIRILLILKRNIKISNDFAKITLERAGSSMNFISQRKLNTADPYLKGQ